MLLSLNLSIFLLIILLFQELQEVFDECTSLHAAFNEDITKAEDYGFNLLQQICIQIKLCIYFVMVEFSQDLMIFF